MGELPVSELERVDPIEDFKHSYGETKSMASINRTLAILRRDQLGAWPHAADLHHVAVP